MKNKVAYIPSDVLWNNCFTDMVVCYSRHYQENGKNFITCFLKFGSIRSACEAIVKVFKDTGIWKEVLESGKDFSEYANKQKIEEKWKPVLAETLLIIWSILQPSSAECADAKGV